jgi:hypothetical protein
MGFFLGMDYFTAAGFAAGLVAGLAVVAAWRA